MPYYQPWLVLINDGAPDYGWQDAARRASTLSAQRKLVSLPIGVQGADLDVLSQFCSKPAVALDGLQVLRTVPVVVGIHGAGFGQHTSSDASVQLPGMDS